MSWPFCRFFSYPPNIKSQDGVFLKDFNKAMPSYTLELELLGVYMTDMPGFEIWEDGVLDSSYSVSSSGTSISVTISYGGALPSSLEFRFDDASPEAGRTIEIQSVKINDRYVNTGNFLSVDVLTNGGNATVDIAEADFVFDISAEPDASEFTTGATQTFTAAGDRYFGHTGTTAEVFDMLGGNDTAYTGSGNDKISGGAGNDLIRSNGGDDLLFGDAGSDRIYAGDGDDYVHGGDDNDFLFGNDGDDELHGGAGVDRIYGHADNDILTGGDGNDTLGGGAGDDSLFGDAGDDFLIAGQGNDTLDGGADNDVAYGGAGDDFINGGDGDDILVGNQGLDTIDGGDGADQIFLFNNDFAAGEVIRGRAGVDELILANALTVDFTTGTVETIEDLIGSDADQDVTYTIEQALGFDDINLNGGNDTSRVQINGTVDVTALGTPTVTNVENGFLTGSAGNDDLTITGAQLDALVFGAGTIDFDTGSDVVRLTSTSANLNALGATDGSIVGLEDIDASTAGAAVTIDLNGQTEDFTITMADRGVGASTLEAIAIANSGFETQVFGEGGFAFSATSWTINSGSGGAFNPRSRDDLRTEAPEGDNILFTNNNNTSFSQTLAETLEADHLYVLQVDAGARADIAGGTYTINLYAGATLIGTQSGTSLGKVGFDTITVTANSSNFTGDVGSALRVELVNNINSGQIMFDNVRLSKIDIDNSDAVLLGSGNDIINLANGDFDVDEIINGGAGDDTIIFADATTIDFSDGVITNIENLTGSSGNDNISIDIEDLNQFNAIDMAGGTDTIDTRLNGSFDALGVGLPTVTNAENGSLTGTSGVDELVASEAELASLIYGSGTMNFGGGSDTLLLIDNSATLNSLALTDGSIQGLETIDARYSTSAVTLDLTNQSEDFIIKGSTSADTITSGSGDDTINLANGDFGVGESISGGAGTDEIVLTNATTVDFTTGTLTGVETLTGSSGNDDVTYTIQQALGFDDINLNGGNDTSRVQINGTVDVTALGTPTVTNVENGFLTGSAGDDDLTISGAQLDALVFGTGSIDFAGGNDTLNLTSTSVDLNILGATDGSVLGLEEIDASTAGAAVTIDLNGQSEDLTIVGSEFNDTLTGGAGDDIINGDNSVYSYAGGELGVETENYSEIDPGTGLLSGFISFSDADASEGVALIAPNGNGFNANGADAIINGSHMDYKVDFASTGIHYIWVRAFKLNGSDNSYHVGLNDVLVGTENGGPYAAYGWDRFTLNIISSGENEITLAQREDGIILDKFIITDDVGFTPTGLSIASTAPTGGDDVITGGAGVDKIHAGNGDDTINLANGDFGSGESILGGAGTDELVLTNATTVDFTIGTIAGVETLTGSSGNDDVTYTISQALSFDSINLGGGIDNSRVQANGTIDVTGLSTPTVTNTENGFFVGSTGNDDVTITGAQVNALIFGAGVIDFDTGTDVIRLTTISTDLATLAATDGGIVGLEEIDYSGVGSSLVTLDLSAQTEGFIVSTGNASDNVTGGSGDDILNGNIGNDDLFGGLGNDTINGGQGFDEIYGGAGADTIDGGTENDRIYGGGTEFLGDTIDGGAGTDDAFWLTADATFDSSVSFTNMERIVFNNGGAWEINVATNESVDFTGLVVSGNSVIRGDAGAENIIGTEASDEIYGNAGADILDGGNNNDDFFLANGDYAVGESITGGAGNDRITLTNATTIDLSDGTINTVENFTGSAGDDDVTYTFAQLDAFTSVNLQGGNDNSRVKIDGTLDVTALTIPSVAAENGFLTGSASNDDLTITGTQLNAILYGAGTIDFDAGTDVLRLTSHSADLVTLGATDASINGLEEIDASGSASFVIIDVNGQSEDMILTGSDAGIGDWVFGGSGDDIINGGIGGDRLRGNAGVDIINGGTDDDTIELANGDFAAGESIDGGADTDELVLTNATTVDFTTGTLANLETLTGSTGDDDVTYTIQQALSFDDINLGTGTDNSRAQINGTVDVTALGTPTVTNAENGFLTGSASNDDLTITGAQLDALVFGAGTIDFGSGTNDALRLTSASADLNVLGLTDASIQGLEEIDASAVSAIITLDLSGQTENLTVIGGSNISFSADTITTGSGDDNVEGREGGDTIDAGAGNDTIDGGGGDDIIFGGLGNDIITDTGGFASQDRITGGAGADTIDAALGNDIINLANGDFIATESINGGDGTDELILTNATTVDFTTGTLSNLEGFVGSTGDDNITLSVAQYFAFDDIDYGAGTDTQTIDVSGVNDITAETLPAVSNLESSSLLFSTGVDDLTLTGAQLDSLTAGMTALDALGGADALRITTTSNNLNTFGSVDGDLAGLETIDASSATSDVDINVSGQLEAFTIDGGTGNDTLTGGEAGDTIDGGDGNNILTGLGGDDDITGGTGDDIIYGDDITAATETSTQGWNYQYYDLPFTTSSNLSTAGFTLNSNRDHDLGSTTAGIASDFTPATYDTGDDYALKFETTLTITTAGTYTFRTNSDDGSMLFLDGVQIVNNDGLHGNVTVTSAGQVLAAGTYTLELTFFERSGGHVLGADIRGPDTGNAWTALDTYSDANVVTKSGPAADGDDLISGGAGTDTLYGGGGEDTFIFEAASAFAQTDTIMDFSMTDGDNIDISDILTGVAGITSANIKDYISFTTDGATGDTLVQVDDNGTTGGVNFQTIARLDGIVGLDEVTLYSAGDIIV